VTSLYQPLAGRVVMVVGTSANIGTGIALSLARAGAAVACIDRHAETAAAAAAELTRDGGRSVAVRCDVLDEAEVAAAIDRCSEQLGIVDVLVNGAAFYNAKGVLQMPFAEWQEQTRTILDSVFLCTRGVARRLVAAEKPGSVINLISTAGHQGEPGNVAYATAKSGLLNFTRSVAMELAPYGIRVNSLTPTATALDEAQKRAERWGVPGPTEAQLAESSRNAQLVPLGRLPSPRHYGDAAVFLASDAAEMITGTDLRVDSGALARYWRTEPPPWQR
jgi:NAD(P)-dependent dehydrogenase (short-subunit alcohol dehydrogenase family)